MLLHPTAITPLAGAPPCREPRALTRAVLAPRSRPVRSTRASFASWYARACSLCARTCPPHALQRLFKCDQTCCYIARWTGHAAATLSYASVAAACPVHRAMTCRSYARVAAQSTCPAGRGLGYARLIPAVTCGAPPVLLQECIEQGSGIENVTEFCRRVSGHRGHAELQHRGCRF